MSSEFEEIYSVTANGQSAHNDVFEAAYHPGQETFEQSQDPLKATLFPPDQTNDPLAFSAWKKERANALREGREPEEIPPTSTATPSRS